MAVDIKRYSTQLRQLCEDYYIQNISYIEFRMQRNDIFDKIQTEQGLGGGIPFRAEDASDDSGIESDECTPIEQD